MAIEEPKFKVLTAKENYEIREYDPILVAETKINGSFDESGNLAFRILADYIFGNNVSKEKIEMTAPVAQKQNSEKIEMTAPVSQVSSDEGYLVQFTMPSKYTMDTIPKPVDPRVLLKIIPSKKVAVLRYSGFWSEEKYKEKLAMLRKNLLEDKIKTMGEPVFARYNPPFQLWFLRRNEIWIEVEYSPSKEIK